MASMLYSLVRVLLDVMATSHSNEANLRAEVLALRRQVQVLERQIKRVRWEPGDRMILAALRERLPRSAWAALLVVGRQKSLRPDQINFCPPTGSYSGVASRVRLGPKPRRHRLPVLRGIGQRQDRRAPPDRPQRACSARTPS